jgi:tRNA 2-thiouridine synthesizing protein D
VKFSLLVLSSPLGSGSADSAWQFANAAVQAGHQVHRVFFYHEGVYQGNQLAVPPQDETNAVQRWVDLAQVGSIELVLCVSSALKRGVLDQREADRHERGGTSMHPAFTIAGLGELVDASIQSDRLLTFGC